jgi:rhodanese-related sulfurtransferase
MQNLSVQQLADWLSDESRQKPVLLDVREPSEVQLCCLPGSINIPMHMVPMRAGELNPGAPIVAICHHGGRSMQVAMFLERQGFGTLYNLMGGMDAWAAAIDPTMRRY